MVQPKISIRNLVLLFVGIFATLMVFTNIDTGYDFTLEDFHQLQEGMTYEQVVKVIGGDGDEMSRNRNNPDQETYHYSWVSNYGGSFQATFINGKLHTKAEFNLLKESEINR